MYTFTRLINHLPGTFNSTFYFHWPCTLHSIFPFPSSSIPSKFSTGLTSSRSASSFMTHSEGLLPLATVIASSTGMTMSPS